MVPNNFIWQDTAWPADRRVNPNLSKIKGPPAHLSRIGGYRLNNSFQAHSLPVSSYAMHRLIYSKSK